MAESSDAVSRDAVSTTSNANSKPSQKPSSNEHHTGVTEERSAGNKKNKKKQNRNSAKQRINKKQQQHQRQQLSHQYLQQRHLSPIDNATELTPSATGTGPCQTKALVNLGGPSGLEKSEVNIERKVHNSAERTEKPVPTLQQECSPLPEVNFEHYAQNSAETPSSSSSSFSSSSSTSSIDNAAGLTPASWVDDGLEELMVGLLLQVMWRCNNGLRGRIHPAVAGCVRGQLEQLHSNLSELDFTNQPFPENEEALAGARCFHRDASQLSVIGQRIEARTVADETNEEFFDPNEEFFDPNDYHEGHFGDY
jgi:hypothetical protein